MWGRFKEIDWHPDRRELRRFGLMLAAGMPVAGMVWLLIVRLVSGHWVPQVPIYVGGIGGGIGLSIALLPGLGRPVYCVWFALGGVLETIVVTVLLSTFYYAVMMPFGLVMRWAGRQPVQKGFKPRAATYWQEAEQVKDLRRYYRQF